MGNILNIINSDKDFYDTHNGHYMRCVKGAFYSSGSRPNVSARQWAYARLASVIMNGGARKVDKDIWDKYKV